MQVACAPSTTGTMGSPAELHMGVQDSLKAPDNSVSFLLEKPRKASAWFGCG